MAKLIAHKDIDPNSYAYRAFIMIATLGNGKEVKASLDTLNSANQNLRLNQAVSNLLGSLISAGYDVVDYKVYALEK